MKNNLLYTVYSSSTLFASLSLSLSVAVCLPTFAFVGLSACLCLPIQCHTDRDIFNKHTTGSCPEALVISVKLEQYQLYIWLQNKEATFRE